MHAPGLCKCCDFSYYEKSAKYVSSQLEDLDEENLTDKLIPKGSGRAISEEPKEVELDEDQIDEAIALFYLLLEDYVNLLHALPVGIKPTTGDTLYEEIEGDWEWDYEEYSYLETEEEIEINEAQKDLLSLDFLDFFLQQIMVDITIDLILQKKTIQKWVKENRNHIRNSTVSAYLLAIGGKNVVDITDISNLKKLVKAQWSYFQKFAEEIKNGELTGAKILQRVSMYGEAITHGYEQAKAKSHGIKLPEYPADGNQQCFSNCRCHWELSDDPRNNNYVLASWKLNPNAEHCRSCLNNSRKWNPLRVKKQ